MLEPADQLCARNDWIAQLRKKLAAAKERAAMQQLACDYGKCMSSWQFDREQMFIVFDGCILLYIDDSPTW